MGASALMNACFALPLQVGVGLKGEKKEEEDDDRLRGVKSEPGGLRDDPAGARRGGFASSAMAAPVDHLLEPW